MIEKIRAVATERERGKKTLMNILAFLLVDTNIIENVSKISSLEISLR